MREYIVIRSWNSILTVSLIVLLYSILLSSAFAEGDLPELVKSIRFMGGLGYANITYPDDLQDDLDSSETHIGGIGLDLGVYALLPGSNSTAIGINGNAAVDNYSVSGFLGESISMTLSHILVSLSSMHFFSKEIGSGPFVRADLGLSRLQVRVSDLFAEFEAESDYGLGLLLGGGIAFPISDKGKVLLNVDYSLRRIESDNYKILGLSIGYMY